MLFGQLGEAAAPAMRRPSQVPEVRAPGVEVSEWTGELHDSQSLLPPAERLGTSTDSSEECSRNGQRPGLGRGG